MLLPLSEMPVSGYVQELPNAHGQFPLFTVSKDSLFLYEFNAQFSCDTKSSAGTLPTRQFDHRKD